MSQPLIDLQHISKRFDDTLVLDDLSLSSKGKFLCNALRSQRLRQDDHAPHHRRI